MNDRKKTKRKLFNIFDNDYSLNEIPPHSDVNTPKLNFKLTAKRRSTRLKSEIFVERIPPDSPDNDPYAFTKNDFEDTKLVYTPPKKKAKISKSPSFMERIDRYFNIQTSKASNTLSANSCGTTSDATEEAEQKIDKTVHSKASNSPKLKDDDDLHSFIDSIDTNAIADMINNTEIVDTQSQVTTPKKYDRKSNENLSPIVRLSSKERKVLQKRKAKSNTSKEHQNDVGSPVDSIYTIIDSIDTNAIVDMINNTEIVESQSQVKDEIITTPKKHDRKSNENLSPIVRLNSKERKVSSKENKSKTSKKNQNDMVNNIEIVKEKSQVQNEISNCNTTPKKYRSSKECDTKSKENLKTMVSSKTAERKVSCKENKSVLATKSKTKTTKKNQNDEDCRHTLQLLRPRGRKAKVSACQLEHDDSVGSKNNDALNISTSFNNQKELQESLITETSASLISSPGKNVEKKISVSLRKRERRQTISGIQKDNNVDEIKETNDGSQFRAPSLISSPQKTVENERPVPIRKRGRRQTICDFQMDNNLAQVTEINDSSQLPSASMDTSSQKTVENETSVPIRKRGRRPTICGTQTDNSAAEITETNDSNQLPSTPLISSTQKTVENEKSAPIRKRGRRPTICGIQMDNNVDEITETNDSNQLPSAPLISSPQKTLENEISVPLRKRGRRPTISGINIDNKAAEVIETNDSSQLTSASRPSSPQKSLENEKSVPIRKRGRRPTISSIKTDNSAAEITETNNSSQLPSASPASSPQKTAENEISVPIRKRGRRPTICSINIGNKAAEVIATNDSSPLPSASTASSQQKTVENAISVPIRKRGRRPTICGIQMDNNLAEVTENNENSQLPSASLTSSPQKTVENEISVPIRKRGRRPTICGSQMDKNVAQVTETNEGSQLSAASMTSSPQKTVKNEISVPIRKRGRRQTICGIQMDNNLAEVTETKDSSQLPSTSLASSPQKPVENERPAPIRKRGRRPTIKMDNNVAQVTESNDSSQLPSTPLISSTQKTVENDKSVTIRKRGRRPTISGVKIDNKDAEVTETIDSSQLPSASLASSPQKSVENEISVPTRKRGRRPTICGTQTDNSAAEITETNDSSQLPSASLDSSSQKSVENEKPVPIRKRGRRQTICGSQMDNNIAEITETNDSSQLPSASLASSLQKSVETETPLPIRKRGRRKTICGVQMDNNVDEITETNASNQLPSASLASSPQKIVESGISVPIRKRARRKTICGPQMDNNNPEVTETNEKSQLPKKRGRRPTICQTKLENYFTREANKADESSLENQTEISPNNKNNNASDEQKENSPTGSQQVRNPSRKPQKATNTDPKDNKVIEEPKRKRGRPRLSPNVAGEKQVKMRIQKINVAKKPKNTYGRLSKDKLNSANVRRIPKDRLDEALDMLQNEDHEIWQDRNISCNAGIHRYWETRTMTSDQNMKMKYARQFLLRRDWLNLSKVLCLSNQDAKNNIYYPLLVKYATLCLAHTDKEQFHKFVNSLITMADSSAIIKKCTKISRQNEE